MKETQRAETETRSSARLRYFLAGLAILLFASACDAQTRQRLATATLEGHHSTVYSVAFSPDGKTLASGGGTVVKLWDSRTKLELGTLKGHDDMVNSVAFSPDGKTLASGSRDQTIKLWVVDARQ